MTEKFRCKRCNYQFESVGQPKKCPNCGETSIGREKSAQELLEEEN